jgi:hypothetical protein
MGLKAKATGGDFKPIPEGVYVSTCYAVIDLGTHVSDKFKDKLGQFKAQRKVLFQWEVPEERIDVDRDGKTINLPRAISRKYTLSLHEKAELRKMLEAWRGKAFTAEELEGFDVKAVLGASCQIQVVHEHGEDGKVWANVGAIMALPKGTAKPKAENPLTFFSFDDWDKREESIPVVPEWIEKIIGESEEFKAARVAAPPAGNNGGEPAAGTKSAAEEDLPF